MEALGLPPELILGECTAIPRPTRAPEVDWTSVDPHELALPHLPPRSRRERQATGAYATPAALARVMAHEAASLAPTEAEGLPACLDPACGCGSLLVEAMRVRVAEERWDVVAAAEAVRGFDREPASVWPARLAVVLAARQLGATSKELVRVGEAAAANITVRDVLIEPPREQTDWVLMNPPYVRAIRGQADRDRIRQAFPTATGPFDLHVPFIELALRCLRPGGAFAILTTNKVFAAQHARRLRALLAEAVTLKCVVDLEACEDARPEALVDQVLLVGTTGAPLPRHHVEVVRPRTLEELARRNGVSSWRLQGELLRERWPAVRASGSEVQIIAKMTGAGTRPLGSLAVVRGGLRGFAYERCCEALVEGGGQANAMRVLTPGNVRAYRVPSGRALRLGGRRWVDPALPERPEVIGEELWRLFGEPKVVVKGVGPRPTAAWCPQAAALLVAVWGIWGNEELLWGALGLLNSRPVAWLHAQQLGMARIPRGSLRVPMAWVAELPVPGRHTEALAELARLRCEAGDPDRQAALQREIDEAAARAYDLTEAHLRLMGVTPVRPVQA
jgi:predicted RNA methylase